jgi:hypothetical protein
MEKKIINSTYRSFDIVTAVNMDTVEAVSVASNADGSVKFMTVSGVKNRLTSMEMMQNQIDKFLHKAKLKANA